MWRRDIYCHYMIVGEKPKFISIILHTLIINHQSESVWALFTCSSQKSHKGLTDYRSVSLNGVWHDHMWLQVFVFISEKDDLMLVLLHMWKKSCQNPISHQQSRPVAQLKKNFFRASRLERVWSVSAFRVMSRVSVKLKLICCCEFTRRLYCSCSSSLLQDRLNCRSLQLNCG